LEDSWLNPDFATDQIIVLAAIILAALIFLPVVFGALIYAVLSLYLRLSNWWRVSHKSPDLRQEDPHDQAPV
jgi:hypothetical protein